MEELSELSGSRLLSPQETPLEGLPGQSLDHNLRPTLLRDYIGQVKIKENLFLFMEAARSRGDALDHVLLSGPPGLGSTLR